MFVNTVLCACTALLFKINMLSWKHTYSASETHSFQYITLRGKFNFKVETLANELQEMFVKQPPGL